MGTGSSKGITPEIDMKKHLRLMAILLSALFLFSCAKPEKAGGFEPFYRFDVDSPTAWKEPLKNVRFITEGAYSLTPISEDKLEKYGLAPDTVPDEKGMDTLNISGSAEPSANTATAARLFLFSLPSIRRMIFIYCAVP